MEYDLWHGYHWQTILYNDNLQLQKLPNMTFKGTRSESMVLAMISTWLRAQHLDIEMTQLRDAH